MRVGFVLALLLLATPASTQEGTGERWARQVVVLFTPTADPTEIDALNEELGVIIVAVDEDKLYLVEVEVEDARRIDAVLEAYRGAEIVDSAERNSSSSLE